MIYKLLGSLVLLFAGGYVSMAITRFERRRLRVLDGYISLIYYIKGQIDCYAMPLSDIMASADPAVLAACLGLDASAAHPPPAVTGDRPITAMVQESRLYLEPEVERLLTTLTGELGSTYRAEQVARCDHYLTALTEERRKLGDSLPARLRAICTLCLCSALVAALLLW
ncbi:MAG: hypothetical protein IKM33_07600 [Clostridia bacterium]|nr:hypothetical protein [Clostridia bacterium]